MKRKTREIALLLVPVAALALVVPGARWLADWREQKTPTKIRIDSCELQSPTAWEAFQGAETMLVTRIKVPRKFSEKYVAKSVWEISNSEEKSWNSFESGLGEISIGSDQVGGSGDLNTAINTQRTGLLWKKNCRSRFDNEGSRHASSSGVSDERRRQNHSERDAKIYL